MQAQRYDVQEKGAHLVILEGGQIRCVSLEIRSQWMLGRRTPDNDPDIPLYSPIVSRQHGMFTNIEGQWYYTDNPQSLNGTFYNGKKIAAPMKGKKKSKCLKDGDVLRIDNDNLNTPNEEAVVMVFRNITEKETQRR